MKPYRYFLPLLAVLLSFGKTAAGQDDPKPESPYPTVTVDISKGGLITSSLPFDVYFQLTGPVCNNITYVGVVICESDTLTTPCDTCLTCPCIKKEGDNHCFKPCPWLRPQNPCGQEPSGNNTFSILVPPLKPNKYYRFCFTIKRDASPEERLDICAIATRMLVKITNGKFTSTDRVKLEQELSTLFSRTASKAMQAELKDSIKTYYASLGIIIDTAGILATGPLFSDAQLNGIVGIAIEQGNALLNFNVLPAKIKSKAISQRQYELLYKNRHVIGFSDDDSMLLDRLRMVGTDDQLWFMGLMNNGVQLAEAESGNIRSKNAATIADIVSNILARREALMAFITRLEHYDLDNDDAALLKNTGIAVADYRTLVLQLRSLVDQLDKETIMLGHHLESNSRLDDFLNQKACIISFLLSFNIPVAGTTNATFKTRAKWYIVPDLGLSMAFLPGDQSLQPYYGVNFNLFPFNKDARYSIFQLKHNHLGLWRSLATTTSIVVGVTTKGMATGQSRTEDLWTDKTPLFGVGLRMNSFIRITGGTTLMRQASANPLLSSKSIIARPFVAISIDADLRELINGLNIF